MPLGDECAGTGSVFGGPRLGEVTEMAKANPGGGMNGTGRDIPYAGGVLRVRRVSGVASRRVERAARLRRPPPHVHRDFDEAIYVRAGELTMVRGRDEPVPVHAGGLILAPRRRPAHLRQPLWHAGEGTGRLDARGRARVHDRDRRRLTAGGPPDPARLADIYRRHNSEILP
jgi:mannose-6-phosphate isomerase-like protein (cupin superfamily)